MHKAGIDQLAAALLEKHGSAILLSRERDGWSPAGGRPGVVAASHGPAEHSNCSLQSAYSQRCVTATSAMRQVSASCEVQCAPKMWFFAVDGPLTTMLAILWEHRDQASVADTCPSAMQRSHGAQNLAPRQAGSGRCQSLTSNTRYISECVGQRTSRRPWRQDRKNCRAPDTLSGMSGCSAICAAIAGEMCSIGGTMSSKCTSTS
jgi:hypothetical protein